MPLACQCLAGGGQCWRARLAYLKCHLRCPPPDMVLRITWLQAHVREHSDMVHGSHDVVYAAQGE